MAIICILAVILWFLFFDTSASAQQKYPSVLLWKITGKDLTRPSCLCCTMHVQDRRLFYFGDLLYTANGYKVEPVLSNKTKAELKEDDQDVS